MGSRSAGTLSDQIRSALDPPEASLDTEVRGATKAAVLVPLYLDECELHAVFTKRRQDLRRHPGEISFPGGRQDDRDADLIHTAEREAHEEIGLPPDAVEILGVAERNAARIRFVTQALGFEGEQHVLLVAQVETESGLRD